MRLQNSNTSHVTINPNLKLIKITPEYSNTSHVTINLTTKEKVPSPISYSNTSHVTINLPPYHNTLQT